MLHRYFFFPGLLLLISICSSGSPVDSLSDKQTIRTSVRFFHESDFIYGNIRYAAPDSSLEKFDQVNSALRNHYNYLGTEGSAASPQIYGKGLDLYTYIGPRSFDLHLLNSENIFAWKTNKRFSQIDYHTGAFKEQMISIFHSQNISKSWNAGFNFDRQAVKDFMNYSNTFRSRFALFTSYTSKDNVYNIFAHVILNTIKNGVNGGLESDSLFDNTTITNLGIKGLAYRISNAEEHRRNKIFYLSQYLDLGSRKDSTGKRVRTGPRIRLHHRFSYERKSFVFSDSSPDSSFFSDFHYGSSTYDSLHVDEFKNRFAIQIPSDTSYARAFFRNWSSGIFAEIQHVKYGQRADSSWDNVSVGANAQLRKDSASIEVFSEATYVVTGFDKGSYTLEAKASSPQFSFGKLGAFFSTAGLPADLNFRWYDANNFIWKNNFELIHTIQLGINYSLDKYKLTVAATNYKIQNYVFLDRNTLPHQYEDFLNVNQLSLLKKFTFRKWHFDNIIIYQKTDKENILHLPELITDQSLYLENVYFKKALLMSLGVSANFNSSYYADAFMPANAMFFLQSEKKTGGYLRLDLFINAKIKTARIFLKMENIADDIIKRSYYLTPHYPMPGRVLKFGISWRFFDQ